MSDTRVPLSTYRLQLNHSFGFQDARAIVDYLHALGITDCYTSSYLAAVPGSPHGYDVADPTRLNPDLGTDADYWEWIDALAARQMGHVLDLVPNHMGIAKSANPWWQDVLENGACSRFAAFFDIEWRPVKDELADKVLLPILGDQYGEALERQEIRLAYDRGAFLARYYDNTLPIAPDTWRLLLDGSVDLELERILAAADQLPARTCRESPDIARRAAESAAVKRRLAMLVESRPEVRAHVDEAVAALNGVVGQPRSFDRLDALLDAQSYRLAHWRVASEEINYRRFFDVNELAALRVEDSAVFDEVHNFAFELVHRGAATGLRIDHVDGLFAPADYLHRLQARCAHELGAPGPFFVVVEKILTGDEALPADWPVAGTTGYEFAATVNNLFVDARHEQAFDHLYRRFLHGRSEPAPFAELAYRSKKQVLHETMSGDINSLGHQLNRFSERNRHFRDFTLYNLISTIKEVIASFPVYRTYVTADGAVLDHDRRYVSAAVRDAKRRSPRAAGVVFDFIEQLLLKTATMTTAGACEERARFIGRFQQITGPVTAKGIEDTVLYNYNRLLSLNEVGADPTRFGLAPAAVHEWMRERRRSWPAAMSTTSTHDTKRGEDVRARLNVLTEMPGPWKSAVSLWRMANRRFTTDIDGRPAPDHNEEYLLYQTLVGAWPFEDMTDPAALARFRERMHAYMVKALRESGVHSSWLNPDEAYEAAVHRFIDGILDRRHRFLRRFEPFQARVAELGMTNSLAQLAIKITAPGIPDFYQGSELWDLNLVDPDNRRPVDYERRRRALCEIQRMPPADAARELLARRADGRVKLFATMRALAARARLRDVYERGDYVPLETIGARRDHFFAFARTGAGGAIAITCVPRLVGALIPDASGPPLGPVWGDTRLVVSGPDTSDTSDTFVDAVTGVAVDAEPHHGARTIAAASLFARFPIAILTNRWNT